MNARMDSFSATTRGVSPPSGGATTTTTAQTTAMRRTAVSDAGRNDISSNQTEEDEKLHQISTWVTMTRKHLIRSNLNAVFGIGTIFFLNVIFKGEFESSFLVKIKQVLENRNKNHK